MHALQTRLLQVLTKLKPLKNCQRLWVAYSGGVDSHVLLHALTTCQKSCQQTKTDSLLNKSIAAIYVDHQLNPASQSWGQHCEQVCESLGIEYYSTKVVVNLKAGDSLEQEARSARYKALATFIEQNDCLLTAQHQDDQAETMLLQLLRGAGPQGLASMPLISDFDPGYLLRPMLDITREEITRYANDFALQWIEDTSNTDNKFDRNYLRNEVLPTVRQRWPSFSETISRSAILCAETSSYVQDNIEHAFNRMTQTDTSQLSVSELQAFSGFECRSIIRYWFEHLQLDTPTYAQMQQIISSVVNASQDAEPIFKFASTEIRRHGDNLCVIPELKPHDNTQLYPWDMSAALLIDGVGTIELSPAQEGCLDLDKIDNSQTRIQFRQGGESCRLAGRKYTQSLKKLFQQWRVPSWLRDRVPLLYQRETLIAIADFAVCEGFQCKKNTDSISEKSQSCMAIKVSYDPSIASFMVK